MNSGLRIRHCSYQTSQDVNGRDCFFCSFFCSYLSFVSWSGVRENGMLELGSWVLISNGCMEAAFVVRLFALFVLDQWSGDLLPLAFLLCCW